MGQSSRLTTLPGLALDEGDEGCMLYRLHKYNKNKSYQGFIEKGVDPRISPSPLPEVKYSS